MRQPPTPGALACVVCNNQAGTINMDLSSSSATIPCVSITQTDGAMIRLHSTPVYAGDQKPSFIILERRMYLLRLTLWYMIQVIIP